MVSICFFLFKSCVTGKILNFYHTFEMFMPLPGNSASKNQTLLKRYGTQLNEFQEKPLISDEYSKLEKLMFKKNSESSKQKPKL